MKRRLPVTILSMILVFSGGYYLGRGGYVVEGRISRQVRVVQKQTPEAIATTLDMTLFWKSLDELEERYLNKEKLDGESLLYGAISGMVSSFRDPYTAFYTPEQNTAFQEGLEGIYEGIGAQLGFKDEQLVIVSPLKNSPTEKAGVKPGDAILTVNGEATQGWSLPQAVSKIRGQEGTSVTLLLQRDKADTFGVAIVREEIKISSVQLEWVGERQNIAHLRLLRFGTDTKREWDQKMSDVGYQMSSGVVKGIILDVRSNPGGFLDAAIYLASDFFNDGVVVKREFAGGKIEEFRVDRVCRLCQLPVVVLVNEGSASASEIVAGAIQTRGRGELVGEKTFGKGTVQEAVELGDGASLHITTARWLLPDGTSIDGGGIEPDVKVGLDSSTDSQGRDLQLEKAVELLEIGG